MIELTEEELKYAPEEDIAFFNKITDGLPTMAGKNGDGLDKFGVPIPYHSGPHILRHFRDTIELLNPKSIFEIGFNMGHSAMMWLLLSDARKIYSIDVSEKNETLDAAIFISEKFPHRFSFNLRDNLQIPSLIVGTLFDLCFIDGAHDEQSIINDIHLCIALRIPYLLFDDWYPRYGETQKAVENFQNLLQLVKDMHNLRLYKVNYE